MNMITSGVSFDSALLMFCATSDNVLFQIRYAIKCAVLFVSVTLAGTKLLKPSRLREVKQAAVRNLSSFLLFSDHPVDWVADKKRSRFAFPAICWEQSFIPQNIWQVGDATSNIIESVHADVNREGVSCTLIGGLWKGQCFDNLKQKSLHVRRL